MANEDAWPSIRSHGLRSTEALIDLYQCDPEMRRALLSQRRDASVQLRHSQHGVVTVRDQKPMTDEALRRCLVGVTPREWYEMLNKKVFFWPTETRLLELLGARAYRKTWHCVLTVDSKELIFHRLHDIRISAINSGSTLYVPVERGRHTFQTLDEYPYQDRVRARGISHAIAEITFDYSIPNIREYVLEVRLMKHGEKPKVLYQR